MFNPDLTPFGFTATESRVYATLLQLGPATGYAVARAARLARANASGALDGLVTRRGGSRLRSRARPGEPPYPAPHRRSSDGGDHGPRSGANRDLELAPCRRRDRPSGARPGMRLALLAILLAACRAAPIPVAARYPAGT